MKRILVILTLSLLFCTSAVQGQKSLNRALGTIKARLTTPLSVKRGSFSSLEVAIAAAGKDLPKSRALEGYTARDISISKSNLDKHPLTVRSTPSLGSLTNHILIANPSRNLELSDNIITTTYSIAVDNGFPKDVDSFALVVTMADDFDVVIPIKVEQVERVKKSLFKEDSVQAKWKEEFLAFLEQEHYPDSIFPTRKSSTSMAFISFCKMWRKIGLFDAKEGEALNPYAAYRFLTIDCGLKCNPKHNIRIYSNFLRRELNSDGNKKVKGNKDEEVLDWFSNMESNQ